MTLLDVVFEENADYLEVAAEVIKAKAGSDIDTMIAEFILNLPLTRGKTPNQTMIIGEEGASPIRITHALHQYSLSMNACMDVVIKMGTIPGLGCVISAMPPGVSSSSKYQVSAPLKKMTLYTDDPDEIPLMVCKLAILIKLSILYEVN